jgi:hypothetical protein
MEEVLKAIDAVQAAIPDPAPLRNPVRVLKSDRVILKIKFIHPLRNPLLLVLNLVL